MNSVKYPLFYMELFCDMFESVLECYELTHISWSLSAGVMQEWAGIRNQEIFIYYTTKQNKTKQKHNNVDQQKMRYSNRISNIHTAGLSENVSDFL